MPRNNQLTRQQKEISNGIGVAARFLLAAGLIYGIWIAYEMSTDPSQHPVLNELFNEIMQQDPTMMKVCWIVLGVVLISWRMYSTSSHNRENKRRLKAFTPASSEKDTELVATISLDSDAGFTWQNLTRVFPGLNMEVDGLRATNWRFVQSDQSRMQLTMSLSYDRISTGQNSRRPDPRVLNCMASVKGRGAGSSVTLNFTPEGMLDNRFTAAIVDETKVALKRILKREIQMNEPMDEFDRVIAAQEKLEAEEQNYSD